MQKRNLKPILFHVISAFYESGQVNIQATDGYLQDIKNQTSRGSSRLLVAAAFVRLQVNTFCRLSGIYTTAMADFYSNTSLSWSLEDFQRSTSLPGALADFRGSSQLPGSLADFQRQQSTSRVIGRLPEAAADFQGQWQTTNEAADFQGHLQTSRAAADFQACWWTSRAAVNFQGY